VTPRAAHLRTAYHLRLAPKSAQPAVPSGTATNEPLRRGPLRLPVVLEVTVTNVEERAS
jgi:hypothetical protein